MDYERMYSQEIAPLPREEFAHRLVRLDTEIREQLDREGWEGSHPDGFLTEEELLNAARTQGILKRKIRNWRRISFLALVWLLVSCGIILSMVIVGNNMVKEMEVRDGSGILYAKGTRNIVQTAAVSRTFKLDAWSRQNPVNILNLDRIVLIPDNGTIITMVVAAADADFGSSVLTIQSPGNGFFVMENGTATAIDLETSQLPKEVEGRSAFRNFDRANLVQSLNAHEGLVRTPGNNVPGLIQSGYCVCGLSRYCTACD